MRPASLSHGEAAKAIDASSASSRRPSGSLTRWVRAWLTVASLWLMTTDVWAQNDWQFPDPYFGAVEFGKSRSAEADRQRPRVEGERPHVSPAQRSRPRRAWRRHAAATARR